MNNWLTLIIVFLAVIVATVAQAVSRIKASREIKTRSIQRGCPTKKTYAKKIAGKPQQDAPKRKRGRPRKNPANAQQSGTAAPKRKPGRPRKNPPAPAPQRRETIPPKPAPAAAPAEVLSVYASGTPAGGIYGTALTPEEFLKNPLQKFH